jgi:hypothetical protein
MGDGLSFDIALGVTGAAGIESAATKVATLGDQLSMMKSAATQAADAMMAGETAYRQAESAADRAAKALERIGLQAAQQKGKLQAALDAGDAGGAERASQTLAKLSLRQSEAVVKADAAKAAMDAQAAACDRLKVAAGTAADAEAKLSRSLDGAKTAAATAAKAHAAAAETEAKAARASADAAKVAADGLAKTRAAAAGSGKVNEAAEAFTKLGGPLGQLGGQAFGAADGMKKLNGSLGGAGPYAAVAIGITAITAAALAGTFAIVKWAVMLSDKEGAIGKQSERLTKLIGTTFGGLKITALLDGMSTLVDLFDSSTASGNAMKVVFESIMQPLIDGIASLAPKAERLFLQMEIWAMKALIAIKPYGSVLVGIGEMFAIVAVAAVAVVVVAIGAAIAATALIAVGVQWLIGKVVDAGKAVLDFGASITSGMTAPINAAVAFLQSLSLATIGGSLIDGLIAGITGAGPGVIKAITGLAGDAISAARSALKVNSPSLVFAEIGGSVGEGMVKGVEGSTDDVQGSLEALVSPPSATSAAPPAASAAPTASSSAGGAPITFIFNGVEGAEDAQTKFEAAYLRMVEGDASQLGMAAPA